MKREKEDNGNQLQNKRAGKGIIEDKQGKGNDGEENIKEDTQGK